MVNLAPVKGTTVAVASTSNRYVSPTGSSGST